MSNNKYTVGKYLRKQKRLRRKDQTATIIEPKKQLADYIKYLKDKGVVIDNLAVAEFKTKNGLPYYGLLATQVFMTNKIFIRVPVNVLLNTKIAFFSDAQEMFEQNPQYFSKQFDSNWEDHILLAFLLRQYTKGKESQWYHLITNLPREIDYVIFWKKQQIRLLEDPVLEKMIDKQLKKYYKQMNQFLIIAKKYPQLFPQQILIEENIRWLHIHLVTRCFGKYFQYTTMVPFAQLLNHQCSDVYYTMYYKQDNPHNPHEEFYDQKLLTQQQLQEIQTSDGTYNSQEFEDQLEQWKLIPQEEDTQGLQSAPVIEEISKNIKSIENFLYNFINFGDNVSFSYLLQTYEALQMVKNSEISVNVKRIELHRLQANNSLYLNLVKSFHRFIGSNLYTDTLAQKKNKKKEPEQQPFVDFAEKYFPTQWQNEKFDEFLMLCSTKDQFEKGAQVFFCYGRLSNRMLLMRYGISLEHNKYNHIYLRLNTEDYIFKDYKMFPKKLKEHRICKIKKIKVKRTKICLQLIVFLRAIEWNLHQNTQKIFFAKERQFQTKVIRQGLEIFSSQMGKFSRSLEENVKLLTDKNIGYHQYFALVYIIEKQRIIQAQIKLLKIILVILGRIQKKISLEIAMLRVHDLEDNQQMKINRIMMKPYFDRFNIK